MNVMAHHWSFSKQSYTQAWARRWPLSPEEIIGGWITSDYYVCHTMQQNSVIHDMQSAWMCCMLFCEPVDLRKRGRRAHIWGNTVHLMSNYCSRINSARVGSDRRTQLIYVHYCHNYIILMSHVFCQCGNIGLPWSGPDLPLGKLGARLWPLWQQTAASGSYIITDLVIILHFLPLPASGQKGN